MSSLEPLLFLFKHWGLCPSLKSSGKSHSSSKTPNYSSPRPKLSVMPMGMVWQEKTRWFFSVPTNTDEQRNMLLVSQYSCSQCQCCQRFFWFGCCKDNNKKLNVCGVAGQGPTSEAWGGGVEMKVTSSPWSRWLCSGDWPRHCLS